MKLLLSSLLLIHVVSGQYTWHDTSGTFRCNIAGDDVISSSAEASVAACEALCDGNTLCVAYSYSTSGTCTTLDACFGQTWSTLVNTVKLKKYDGYDITEGYGCPGTPTIENGASAKSCIDTCTADPTCSFMVSDENANRCLYFTTCDPPSASVTRVLYSKVTPEPTNAPTRSPTLPTPAPTFGPTVLHQMYDLNGTMYCNTGGDDVISTTTESSAVSCENLCIGDDLCAAFQFNSGTGNCVLLDSCHRLAGTGGYTDAKIKNYGISEVHLGYFCDGTVDLHNGISAYDCYTQCQTNVFPNCRAIVYDEPSNRCNTYTSCDTLSAHANRITLILPTPSPTTAPTPSPTPSPYVEVGKAKINYNVNDPVKRKNVAKTTITDVKNSYATPSDLTFSVKTVETSAVSNALYLQVNNDTKFKESFAAARGCQPGQCTVLVNGGRRMLTRDLQQEITVSIDFTFSDEDYASFTDLNTTLDDPSFITALAAELGVDENDVEVTATGGTVTIEITVTATITGNPSGEDSIATLQEIQASLNNATTILVEQLGDPEDSVQTVTLDLCSSRDCNGFGDATAPNTDSNGCNTETGICTCTAVSQRWGINCETECTCENGGTCVNSYCHCNYPYYGLKCNLDLTSACSACGL